MVLAKEEGLNVARALGPKKKNIILQNHGYVIASCDDQSDLPCRLLTCGSNVDEAAAILIILSARVTPSY